jgi:mRNA interferase MazF
VSYEKWSVVVVPFPFTDRDRQKRRPAVVVSSRDRFGAESGHSVLAMVTSAVHKRWPLDVVLADREAAGLPTPSLVRMKLFTLDDRVVIRQIGRLSPEDRNATAAALSALLGMGHDG